MQTRGGGVAAAQKTHLIEIRELRDKHRLLLVKSHLAASALGHLAARDRVDGLQTTHQRGELGRRRLHAVKVVHVNGVGERGDGEGGRKRREKEPRGTERRERENERKR